MLNTDGQYRLVFCTSTDTDNDVGIDILVKKLKEISFISKAISDHPADSTPDDIRFKTHEYCVGDSFLSSITFMGCSPYIEFEPPTELQANDVAEFCFIRLSTIQSSISYHAEQFERLKTVPRCKHCRKVIADWHLKSQLLNEKSSKCIITCPNCEVELTQDDLDWRKASGIGNVFLEILNVYLQEAVPTDSFMQQLENITSSTWQYFYTDSNITKVT